MNDGATNPRLEKPLGRVVKNNPDGTTEVELDMTNPTAWALFTGYLVGGRDGANQILKSAQDTEKN